LFRAHPKYFSKGLFETSKAEIWFVLQYKNSKEMRVLMFNWFKLLALHLSCFNNILDERSKLEILFSEQFKDSKFTL